MALAIGAVTVPVTSKHTTARCSTCELLPVSIHASNGNRAGAASPGARTTSIIILAIALLAAAQQQVWARSATPSAISGRTDRPGDTGGGCGGCHGGNQDATVAITGSSSRNRGQSGTYTITNTSSSSASGKAMGAIIAAGDAGVTLSAAAPLEYQSGSRELIHNASLAALHTTNASGTATYTFTYTMPSSAAFGSSHTLYAVSRINSATNSWNYAPQFVITTSTPAPTINSATTKTGTVGVAFSYQIGVTSGTTIQPPTSYNATSRPPGVSVNTSSGLLSGTPTTAGPFTTALTATNLGGSDGQNLAVTIGKGSQTLTFGSQVVFPTYSNGGTFNLVPAASATSGLAPVYTSTTTGVCTKPSSGTLVNIINAGTCTIVASQPGDANWFAAPVLATHTRSINILKASQTINFPVQTSKGFVLNGTFSLSAAAATSGLAVTYTSQTPLVCTTPGTTSTTVTMLDSGTCTIQATQTGNVNYNAASPISQDTLITETPGTPTMGTRFPGDTRATILFTAPANPASILFYTATCTAIGQTTRTATSKTPSSPFVVTGMTNAVTYTCSVTATNSFGTSIPSNTGTVAPSAALVAPTIRSGSTVTLNIGTSKSFLVVSTGTPNAVVAISGAALPSAVTYVANTVKLPGTGSLGGIPAAGTVGNYAINFTATNSQGTSLAQIFTLVIAKGDPVITFPALADVGYSPVPFALAATVATPNSILSAASIVYSTTTPSICSTSGANGINVTMLATGTCTIVANRPVDASYNAATAVMQSFLISQASQSITFGPAAPRNYSPGLSFALNPAATASSMLPIDYSSATPAVCSIVGTTVSVLSAGTCQIAASQDGNSLYLAAADVVQDNVINPAAQTITFPGQSAQPYVEGGSFSINPIATSTSGLTVSYASTTPATCTVAGATVTIVDVGTCSITASQPGDTNYTAAAPIQGAIAINAVPPGAPTLNGAVASDTQAKLSFTPSANTGGAPVLRYRATCNPGNLSALSVDTPVTVGGLTNGVAYTCAVQALNAAGLSSASNSIGMITPFLNTGTNLWASSCSGCHGAVPSGLRFNAAGTTGTVIDYVRGKQAEMIAEVPVQALTLDELAEIAKYIQQQVPVLAPTAPYVTPIQIDVASHITLNTVSFNAVEAVSSPANGILSAFTGTIVTYTPNPGFAGMDTFTYRGIRPGQLVGDTRAVTVTVQIPIAPVITSPATANGVFGQSFSYQITATNTPGSFGASGLGGGVNLNPVTGLISGTPGAAGVFNIPVTATNPGGTGMLTVQVTISPANQSITFGAQADRAFSPGGTFGISAGSASSGLTVVYTSLTSAVCSVSVTTVTTVAAGTCTIAANQGGNGNYNAALQVTQSLNISATAPGAPLIGTAAAGDTQASIAFAPPANSGGSPITSYNASCTPSGAGSNSVSPITVTGLTNGVLYTCSVTATSVGGTGGASATVMVTPNATPVLPAFTSAGATTFTVLSPGNFSVTATGTPAPSISPSGGTPPTGVTFSAGLLSGTPATGTAGGSPYALTFTATNGSGSVMQSFMLTVAKASQSINFANPGARNFSVTPFAIVATASSGLSVSFTSNTPGVCTVAGNNVTMLATGVCSISADVASTSDYNAATTVTNGFSISPAAQSISFGAQTSPINFSTSAFAISPLATASSGLAVVYSSITPTVCSISVGNVTPIRAAVCTIAADQGGNANFAAAVQATQSITINPTPPSAPAIGVGIGSDAQVSISFTPPSNTGGRVITQYNATCTPSGSGSGSASPVVVAGLSNGTPYSCSVTATNAAALTSLPSGSVMVTPTSANGAALWATPGLCSTCHGATPAAHQLNGAGSTATVLNYVRANQNVMKGYAPVQSLSQAELASIAAYISDNVPWTQLTTPFNTPVPINVSSHITLDTNLDPGNPPIKSTFTLVEVVTPPANGLVSAFSGITATYTPTPGFIGIDTFTYRGRSAGVTGDPRVVTITVLGAVPSITSAGTANGTYQQPFTYQIVATGTATGYAASGLPPNLVVDNTTGAISGLPQAAGTFNVTMSASNASGTTMLPLDITIAKAPQTITFAPQIPASRLFVPGGTFSVNPQATGGLSGNLVTYSSTSGAVCAVNGSTVGIIAAGACTIAAGQTGDANYLAAPQVAQSVAIAAGVPGIPAIGTGIPGDAQAQISFVPPGSNGGSPIIDYTATCVASGQTTRSGTAANSPVTVTSLLNGITYGCSVTARNSAGSSGASAPMLVTPSTITPPDAPLIGVAIPGDGAAAISFSPPANNGGAAISLYTASCNPGMATASSATSPINFTGLTNGVTYTCSVRAANTAGLGPASATVDVIPELSIALSGVVSRKSHAASGPFDVAIDSTTLIGGLVDVEPRTIGAGHTLVFQFNNSITATGLVSTTVGTASAVISGNDIVVTLNSIPDNRRVTVSLTNVNGVGLNASASLGFLVGDVNGTRSVNSSDISGVKARSGQTTTALNFKFDLNASGAINSSDISAVKARSGLVLP